MGFSRRLVQLWTLKLEDLEVGEALVSPACPPLHPAHPTPSDSGSAGCPPSLERSAGRVADLGASPDHRQVLSPLPTPNSSPTCGQWLCLSLA